ncbi:MAG: hypothetical protein FWD13_00450, partial [Treponema sp.]|nr:hypothetical protein [Treponema sp.]
MKKLAFFIVIFVFLANLGWGQNTYRHNGTWFWEQASTWTVLDDDTRFPLDPQPATFPGQNPPYNDTVIFNDSSIQISQHIRIGTLEIRGTTETYFAINDLFEVENLILDNRFNFTGSSPTVHIKNITVTNSGERMGPGLLSMNGSTVIVPHDAGTLTINPVVSDLGKINAGSRNVTLTIPGNGGNINIDDITTTGTVTINVTGNNNVVNMKDISAIGNILVNDTGSNNIINIGDIKSDGTVTINSGPGGSVSVDSSDPPPIGTGNVTVGGTNIVVGTWDDGDQPNDLLGAGIDYYYIDIKELTSGDTVTTADINYPNAVNIYIINVGDIGTRSFTFSAPNGYIEFRQIYTTTGALTLNPGSGGVRFTDGTIINLGSNDFVVLPPQPYPAYNMVTLNGIVSITAANVRLLEIAGSGILNVTGNLNVRSRSINNDNIVNINASGITVNVTNDVSFGPDDLPGPNLPTTTLNSVSAASVTLRAPITTTGDQTYGSVTLFSNTPGSAIRTLTGATVTINGAITSTWGSTATPGDIALQIVGNAVFNTAFTVRTLEVTGTTGINANITTSGNATIATIANATQVYGGAVTLGAANITLTGPAGTLRPIRFNGTVNGVTSGAQSLTITTGNPWFAQAVGGLVPLDRVSVTGTGVTTIHANIITAATTGNGQDYNGNVTLGATANLTGGSGSTIRFGGTVTGAFGLTLTDANVLFTGIVGVTGTRLTNVTVNGTGTTTINAANIWTGTGGQTYNGNVILGNNVTLTGNVNTLIRFNGTVNSDAAARQLTIGTANAWFDQGAGNTAALTSITVAGITQINANITTTGIQTYGAVTLGGTPAGTRTLAGSIITANGVITGGDNSLTVNSAAGIAMNAAAGNNVSTVILNNTGATGAISYNSNRGANNSLNISAVNSAATGGNITITEATGNIIVGAGGIRTATQQGLIGLTATVGSITVTGNIGSVTAQNGNVTLSALSAGENISITGTIDCYQLIALTNRTDGVIAVNGNININELNPGNGSTGFGLVTCTVPSTIYFNAFNFEPNENNIINPGGGQLCLDLGTPYQAGHFNTFVNGNYHMHNLFRHLVYYSASSGNTLNNNVNNIAALIVKYPDFSESTHRFINIDPSVITADDFNSSAPATNYQPPPDMHLYFTDIGHTTVRLVLIASNAAFVEFRGYNSFQNWFANDVFDTKGGGIRLNNTHLAFPDMGTNSLLNKVTLVGNTNGSSSQISITALGINLGIDHGVLGTGSINVEGNNIDLTLNAIGPVWDQPGINAPDSSVAIFKSIPAGIRNLIINSSSTESPYNINLLGNLDVETLTINATTNIGSIRQPAVGTSVIKANTVNINATGAVTLNNPGNEVNTLTITNAGGAVQFINNASLVLAGIACGSQNITLTTTGTASAITQSSGTIINTTGALTLNATGDINLNENNNVGTLQITGAGSAVRFTNNSTFSVSGINAASSAVSLISNANLNITGVITCERLALQTAATGTIDIGSGITVASNNATHDNTAALYITTGSLDGAGGITLNSSTGTACVNLHTALNYTGTVNDLTRIHYHFNTAANTNIVYRPGVNTPAALTFAQPYFYINSNSPLGASLNHSTTGTGSIYIIDVDNSAPANSRSVTFATAASGFIEVRGIYTSSGALNLTPGDGGVRLRDATINITGNDFSCPFPGAVILNGETGSTITADDIRLGDITGNGNSLTLTASNSILNSSININALLINGNALFGDALPPVSVISAFSVTVTGNCILRSGVTTTGTGNFQDYESIELYSTQAAAAERILTGETITTNGVNGGGCALTINGNVTFNGATNNNIRLLTVNTGTAIINGNIVSTTGGQVYNGPVRLNNNITFTGNANTTIRFANTVSSNNSTPQELTVATAIVRFDNTVGGDPNFPIARVNATGTPTGTNTHQINANITTVATTDNGQNYTGNVTLGANVNLTSGAGSTVQFGGTVNSNAAGAANARALTITNANVEFNGIVGGGNALASITVNANPATNTPGVTRVNANITTSGIQSYAEVELVGVMRTLISTGGSISASGVVTGSNGITVNASQGITMNADNVLSGNVTLNNTQGTSANNISFGSTLGITLSSTNNAANGQIVLTQSGALVIAGLRTSTVTPATGSIVLGVSPQAVGNITQTGIITTGSLTINSSGVITLTDNNAVGSLAITGAGGAVKFTNNAALSITSINGTLANDVDILSDTGSITVNGNIDTTGAIKLTSGNNQNITINGTSIINCDSLALKTGPSDASTGVVTINGSITVTGNIEDHDDEDAVYIYAGSLAGTGSIWLGASSWVCADLLLSYTYSGTVTDDRIHFHTRFGRNIVYSIGPLSGFNTTPPITEPYFYLQADMNLSSSLSLDTSGNIYIVNIGNTVNANSRSINFTTTGFIEVRGGYTSSGTLTLNPGTGGLRLRGAVINISNNPFNANSAVLTLVGGTVNSITASNITLNTVTGIDGANNDLTLNAGSGNVNLNGLVGTNIRDFRVTGTGININTNVTTTGPQVYNGPVIINGARDVTGAAGAANTIEFTNTINGSERLRVITANARFYGQVILGEFSMGSAAGNGGTAYIRTGISTSVTTGTGNNSHRYRGPVVLENDVTFIANTGTVIRFDGAVSGGFNLTASNNTNVRFAAAVGGGSPLRNIDIYGTTTLNTDVTFTGINAATSTFRFRGTVSSFNATARALTITNANVIFDSNVGAASNPITSVVVNTGTATINGNIVSTTGGQTYNGPVRLNNNITFTGNANTTIRFANIVSSNDNTPRELTVSTAIVRFDNTVGGDSDYPIARVNATGTPTGTNTHQINADITTTATIGNGQNYTGNLTLGANVNLTSGAESAIRFGGTVNSNVAGAANARALNITNANVEFNGVVGGGNVLASIIVNANPVTNTPGVTRINANINTINNQSYAAVNLDSVTRILTSTNGSISASGVVTGPNGITVNASQGITMNADNVLSGIVTLNNTQGTSANNISFGNTGDITLSSINNAANGQIVITQSGELIVNGLRTSTATPATGSIILGISPQTVGDITQTEIITTGSLTINSSGVITLINDNTVSSLTITGAGGAVQFTNNAALSIAGINGLTGVSQDVSIITNSIGSNISQSGTIITDGILSLTSSGTINLNNSGNNIRTLTIPSAGGAVDFNNTGMLTINGISAGSNNVTIETTGAITVNNSITTTGDGTLRLTSGKDEDITIGAAINSYNLILAAGNHVESEGIVYINNVITVRKVHPPDINASNCYDNAAVHIFAGELHGNGSINLPGDDSFVCADILIVSDYSGNVTGDRIHYHSRSGMHIVYSTEPKLTSYPGITGPYLFLQANSDLGSPLNVLTSGSGNIYIIEVENVTYANTRSVIFTTGTDGNIEFRGNYTSSGTLTLIPGTDGVYLNNANINLTGSTNPFITGTVTLNGTVPAPGSEITASAITLGNITGNNNDLTLTGTATLNGGTDIGELQITGETAFLTAPINALSVNVTGNSTIGTNINTTGSTGQVYNGNVTLTASIHLNAGTNPVTLGNTAGRIAGGNNALTITGNAVLNGTSTNIGVLQVNGNAVFQTALLTAVTVNVSGNSTINHDITTTAATGTVQVYTGPVTIGGAARNLTGITGSTILFSNTLNGAQVLTVTNANVIFSDQVGNDEALTGIIVNGNGTATINANTYTTGDQNYTGNVIINNNVTISTTTGNQTFGADQNDRTVTLNGNTIFTAAATAAIRFNGAVIGTGTIDTTAGITRVIRGITTYGNQTYNSAVTVGTGTAAGPVVFTANTVGSAITFEGTIQSNSETAEQLSITSSNIIFKGSIGSSIAAENPIAGVTANGSVTITAPAAFINTTTGGQTYNGSVTLGNNINFTGNAGTVVWFNGTVNGDNNIRTL